MEQLAQEALSDSDLTEKLPLGRTVNFSQKVERPEGKMAGGADSGTKDFTESENGEEPSGSFRMGPKSAAEERPAAAGEKRYFGSVKFFKNLILLAVGIAIVIPTVLAAAFWRNGRAEAAALESQRAALSDTLTDLQAQYDQLAADKLAEETIWGGSVAGQVVKTEPLDYQTLYPDFYVDTPIGPTAQDDGTMYLTFDDGPSSNTPLLLSTLRNRGVKATFFVVGGDTEKQRQWMRDIVEDGHTLGMHSYTHNYHQIYASVEAFLDDYYKLFTNIKEATGQTPTIFRLPGGSVNSYDYPVYQEIVAEMLRRGFVFYDWNLSSGDASSNYISSEQITSNILDYAPAFPRGIVLFHDAPSKDSTVEALGDVIDGLRDQGFTFASLTREVRPILFNYTDYQPD
jgi:peptidoglycan/xylan/chitin deacetylase (PgdA/CDA1 family)